MDAWLHWCNVQTLWASDGGYRTGLRLADVQAYMALQGIPSDERKNLYQLLRACEGEALQTWAALHAEDALERERKQSLRK